MDDSKDSPPPAKRHKRTDENGTHGEDEHDNGTSQTKRFARCTKNKVLCAVCSKPDCGKCANCQNRATGHQACRLKPKEQCLTYIKEAKILEEKAQSRAATTALIQSKQNATNGELVASAHAGVKGISNTDPKVILQHVSSKLVSLASKYSDCLQEINQLNGIIGQALCSPIENSTQCALGTSTTASVTSASKSHQKIPQYGTLCANTATAASTSFLCVTSASEVQKANDMSSITDVRHTPGSVASLQHNSSIKTNTNQAKTVTSLSTTAMPVLKSSIAVLVSNMPNSTTSACTKHVLPSSIVAISSRASTDIASISTLNGTSLMSSSQSTFTGTVPASTSAAGPTSPATGRSLVSTSTRLTSGSTGKAPVSTTTSSIVPSGSTGFTFISPWPNTSSTGPSYYSTSTRIADSSGFMRTSRNPQSTYAIPITGSVAPLVPTTTITRPLPASSGSRSHAGSVQLSTASPLVTSLQTATKPIQLLELHTLQTSLEQTPVPPPTAPLQFASPTPPNAFQALSLLPANQRLPSASAVTNDFLTPCSSLTVEATMEAKVMQKMKQAFSSITVDLHVTKCGISGPPGTGKTHIKALLLNQPRPTQRASTALSTRAEEVTNAEILVNAVEMRRGLRWTVLQKEHWARLLANTIYNSTPPIDSSNQSSSRVGGIVEATSAVPFRDVSEMTYRLLLEMYRENKPKRKRLNMNRIHLIYFVDTGGQPQFQEILPNFVRSSINFLVHKLSEELDDCPQFEYWLNGNKYTIPEVLRVSNMSIITQSVRSVCSSIRSEQCDQRSPTVAILGTFKDKLTAQCGGDTVSMEEIIKNKGNSIERRLQNYVGQGARKCSLMKCTRDSFIFPVDASKEGWNPNSEVIKSLRNEVHAYGDKVQLKGIPLSYFVFLQNLKEFSKRQHMPFIDKHTLQQVVNQGLISLDTAQIEEALNFFADVNLILYYPSSSMLSNFIFMDPNFLYERVTEIIVASFHHFDSCTANNNFNNTGIITALLLDTIPSLRFAEYPSFTRQMFLSLLQDLFIMAELENGCYFMPCVLKLENLESLSSQSEKAIVEIKMYMNYNEVSGPLIISFGDKISPRGLFCAMVTKLSRNFGWRLREGPNAVRCRNMIEFCVCNNKSNVVSPPLGTALLCDKLTHLEVYTTCEKSYCCNIRKAILSSLYTAGSSLKYSFTAIDVHAGFYCNTCPAVPKHHTTVSQREDSGVWQEKCSFNTRKRAVPVNNRQDVWFQNLPSTENSSSRSVPIVTQVITELVPNTNRWFDIAVYLEINLTEIERIRQDKDDEKERFVAVVERWQKNGRPPFTWSTVVQVLESQIVQEHNLADAIRKRYLL